MSLLSPLYILHVILVPLLLTLNQEMFARNRCFASIYPRAERSNRFSVFIVNFKLISHLGLVFLLLILSMCLIDGSDSSYFSRF